MASHEHDDDAAGADRAEDQRDGATDPTVAADGEVAPDPVPATPPALTPGDEPADAPADPAAAPDVSPTETHAEAPSADGEAAATPADDGAGAEEPSAEAPPTDAAVSPAGDDVGTDLPSAEAPPTDAAVSPAGEEAAADAAGQAVGEAWSPETSGEAPPIGEQPPEAVSEDSTAESYEEASAGGGEPAVPEPEAWEAEPYEEAPAEAPPGDDDLATLPGPDEDATGAPSPESPGGVPGRAGAPVRERGPAPARSRGPAARRAARADRPPPAPPPAAAPAAPVTNRWMVVLLSVLTVAVVVLAIYAISLGRRDNGETAAPTTTSAQGRPPVTLPPGAFTNFRDDETGFSIRYPSAWGRYDTPVREIRLLVGDGPYSVRVRSRRTEEPTTTQNLANVKAFADGSIAGPTVVVLQQESVSVNGLIGFRYLYTFTDESSGIQGAHLHYFLFQGHKMHDLIFQALPTETFAQIEGVFNQMLESFRSDPEPASTAPPTTTG